MLTGENGILTQAQRAKNETKQAQANEDNTLASYESYLNSYSGENTEFTDSLENKVIVPAGFRVVNPEDNVEDGIIIEDVTHGATAGSQFVWIPVGTIHRKDKEDVTITLGRYVFNTDGTINNELSKTEPTEQLKTSLDSQYYFTEGLKNSSTVNTHAKDIETFISKVNNETHGYYIARYEARTSSTTQRTGGTDDSGLTQVTVKPNDYVYNYVTQAQAASLSQGMYADSNFTSDLVNSYAWDTAIDFLQKCDNREEKNNNPYSQQNSLNVESLAEKGTNNLNAQDVVCNIYDMASNCFEWTTETYSNNEKPCVIRGGFYNDDSFYTFRRHNNTTAVNYDYNAFRPLLYL